ncbi:MAG TPA: DUF4286 family protein [Arachidicoccus soli]|uniref:DUF4286 family protein n=1 Tax=Arachidicoccus soli TaxID=2341117 RepID=A0A386HMK6_9BACT|nr:DUF4286 family protein [Arachidicoccus soli]AYD46760.1 DUF4286 family protein [Arachidicoccus soli]HEU0226288.1 DUF4286 family protein [Arachidicoccus soli]
MYLYNITIKIAWEIHEDWLIWMREENIPFLYTGELISKHLFLRLKDIEETDGPTYALQLFLDTEQHYNKFIMEYLSDINQVQKARWGNNMYSFATLMEVVH